MPNANNDPNGHVKEKLATAIKAKDIEVNGLALDKERSREELLRELGLEKPVLRKNRVVPNKEVYRVCAMLPNSPDSVSHSWKQMLSPFIRRSASEYKLDISDKEHLLESVSVFWPSETITTVVIKITKALPRLPSSIFLNVHGVSDNEVLDQPIQIRISEHDYGLCGFGIVTHDLHQLEETGTCKARAQEFYLEGTDADAAFAKDLTNELLRFLYRQHGANRNGPSPI